jgi:hypothetical protein
MSELTVIRKNIAAELAAAGATDWPEIEAHARARADEISGISRAEWQAKTEIGGGTNFAQLYGNLAIGARAAALDRLPMPADPAHAVGLLIEAGTILGSVMGTIAELSYQYDPKLNGPPSRDEYPDPVAELQRAMFPRKSTEWLHRMFDKIELYFAGCKLFQLEKDETGTAATRPEPGARRSFCPQAETALQIFREEYIEDRHNIFGEDRIDFPPELMATLAEIVEKPLPPADKLPHMFGFDQTIRFEKN